MFRPSLAVQANCQVLHLNFLQATFDYAFKPHENLGGRPFGIVVALYYKDTEGKDFMDSVFNETVTFKEHDEGFDGET